MQEFGLGQILGNDGVEVCRVMVDGVEVPVVVKAGTLAESAGWCREARAAVETAARAIELRELAGKIRERGIAEMDEALLVRAGELRERARAVEEEYWGAVCRLAREFLMVQGLGTQTEMSVSHLTAAQVNAVFEVAFSLSDPTHAVAGFKGAVVAAVVSQATAALKEAAAKAAKG